MHHSKPHPSPDFLPRRPSLGREGVGCSPTRSHVVRFTGKRGEETHTALRSHREGGSDQLLPPQKALPHLGCSEGFKGQLW